MKKMIMLIVAIVSIAGIAITSVCVDSEKWD